MRYSGINMAYKNDNMVIKFTVIYSCYCYDKMPFIDLTILTLAV